MKSAIVKRLSLALILVAIILLACFQGGYLSASASDLTESNYILRYYFQKKSGEFIVGTEVGIDFESLSESEEEIKVFCDQLKLQLDKLLESEKTYIFEKYNNAQGEMFEPNKHIKFEKTIIDLEKSYAISFISFSSFEVYRQYYQDVELEEITNTFLLQKYNYNISNPYKTGTENKNSLGEVLDSILSAGKGLSFKEQFNYTYKPNFYLDFLTMKSKAKSSANYLGVDSDDYYHYIWKLNNEIVSANLYVNLTFIYYGWWYLLGLGAPLLVMGIAIIFTKVKKAK